MSQHLLWGLNFLPNLKTTLCGQHAPRPPTYLAKLYVNGHQLLQTDTKKASIFLLLPKDMQTGEFTISRNSCVLYFAGP